MALIICPECKKPVSDKADACPHCGYKLEEGKKEKAKKGISPFEFFLIIVVALYLIYLFVTIGKIRKDDSTSEGNEYSIENYNTEKNEITSSSEVVVSSEQDALKKYNASIKSVETNGTAKKSITIQIPDQLSEKQIKEIATYLRNENDIYDRLFIFYLLPDMKEGSGAWATSHYNKNLEIKIMGIDKEAEEKLKNINFEGEGEVIGKWYDNTPYIEHTEYFGVYCTTESGV